MQLFNFKKWFLILLLGVSPMLFISCGGGGSESEQSTANQEEAEVSDEVEALADPMEVKGVGPIQELELSPTIDQELAQEGQALFEQYCTACHKVETRHVGPPVKEVTTRRHPVWIMNMILNPEEMVKKDPIAKQLLAEYLSPMANQNLTEEEARSILEYFRTLSEVESLDQES